MNNWKNCRHILCIRADNMGDLIMTGPAIRALKNSFHCRITVLTSSMGSVISPFIEEIDETIACDLPWVKTNGVCRPDDLLQLAAALRNRQFDAAVIFTVYSQNPLPAAMLACLAGIPKRLAYCRENPYQLLTDWVPEKEPYRFTRHQVERDLDLVAAIGATIHDDRLHLNCNKHALSPAFDKLKPTGFDPGKKWVLLHPGVSELKRMYPAEHWAEAGKLIVQRTGIQVVISGVSAERALAENIRQGIGADAFNAAGLLNIEEFIAFIQATPLVISVNTGTAHIACATGTPVIVLYALTNPQHTPWKGTAKVLPFSIKEQLASNNDVVSYVREHIMADNIPVPGPEQVFEAFETMTCLQPT